MIDYIFIPGVGAGRHDLLRGGHRDLRSEPGRDAEVGLPHG